MVDLYRNFAELSMFNVMGIDYQIRYQRNVPDVLYLAIHGGGIEPGTSELAEFSANIEDSYYCFEGIRSSGNADLHITSVNFDEPTALNLVSESQVTVVYHGYGGGQVKHTIVGGLDDELVFEVIKELQNAGFSADQSGLILQLGGRNPANVANRNQRGKGVQLEISLEQRKEMFDIFTRPRRSQTVNRTFYRYMEAVQKAVKQVTDN